MKQILIDLGLADATPVSAPIKKSKRRAIQWLLVIGFLGAYYLTPMDNALHDLAYQVFGAPAGVTHYFTAVRDAWVAEHFFKVSFGCGVALALLAKLLSRLICTIFDVR